MEKIVSTTLSQAFCRVEDAPSLGLIGDTPLLRIKLFEKEFPNVEVYAKAEWFNPGGSVKDRPALYMVRDGIERGIFQPGMTLLDSTSGNTGIAYAMLGAALGFPVKLVLPENASPSERQPWLPMELSWFFQTRLKGPTARNGWRSEYTIGPGKLFSAPAI
jgi:threonine synthase